MNISYVIFDMDGVLINSEPASIGSAKKALALCGIDTVDSDFEPYIGAGETLFITEISKKHGLSDKAEMMIGAMYDLYEEIAPTTLKVFPSALPLIKALYDKGYKLAVVTSSAKRRLLFNLKTAGIDLNYFNVIITGSDLKEKKPLPVPYLTAAEKLGADSKDCLVIEDALNGVTSAKAAGMQCVAVTTSFEENDLKKVGADFIVNDIIEVIDILDAGE